MVSVARKNLSSLVSNPNSFSNAHFFLSIHPFSTSRMKRLFPRPEICDVLVNKHQFPPELASLASSRLPQFRSPERADSVLSFLKENSFTTAQLQKMVIYNPRILGFTIEGLKSRFMLFLDLGLSSEEVAKMMSSNLVILHSSMSNRIIPSLTTLKELLGSNEEVARLLRKSAWFVYSDLKTTLMPNVDILRSSGVSMGRILCFLYIHPRFMLIKPDIMKKSVDRAIEFGFFVTSVTFMYASEVYSYTSEGMWEVKLQTLRDLGFSNDDIFSMFSKQPKVLALSVKKMKNVIEFLLATGKYNISCIVANPSSLGYSIEKRLAPRVQILGVLESRNLIENWPALSTVSRCKDDRFFDSFIRPYHAEIGEEHITKCVSRIKGKKR